MFSIAQISSAFAALALSSSAFADVFLMGSTQLAYEENDRDVIQLPICRPNSFNRRVQALKIRVVRGDADINRLAVQFHNGQVERLNVRENFQQGSESRWISLPGNAARCVRRIVVVGDTDNGSNRRAVVQVFGFTGNFGPGR